MLLASKYEEIWAPEVRDFVYISDKAYTRDQILDMEKQMLNTLGFHLTVPTPYQFMSRFFKAANADKQFQLLASFIVESSLPDYSMLKYPGSLLAASAVYVAMKTLGKGDWNDVMEVRKRAIEILSSLPRRHKNRVYACLYTSLGIYIYIFLLFPLIST